MIINQVASDLSISSYSYRYLSARLLVALDNPFDQTTETVLHPLPENGAYGANSQLAPVTGPLVIPTPIDKNSSASLGEIDASYGCGESLPDFPNVSKVSNIFYNLSHITPELTSEGQWVALVKRGECTFAQKIEFAYQSGATAIIVYNEVAGDHLVPMNYDKKYGPGMVTAMMSNTNYVDIEGYAPTQNDPTRLMWMTIMAGAPVVNNSFERIVIATISVSFLILLALSVGWVIIYYFQRFRVMHRRYKAQRQRQDMAERAIKMLKTRKLKRSDKLVNEEESCPICIEDFTSGDVVHELPCHHHYCKKCIEPWIITKGTCPMCKINIFQELGLQPRTTPAAATTTSNNNQGQGPSSTEQVGIEVDGQTANNSNTSFFDRLVSFLGIRTTDQEDELQAAEETRNLENTLRRTNRTSSMATISGNNRPEPENSHGSPQPARVNRAFTNLQDDGDENENDSNIDDNLASPSMVVPSVHSSLQTENRVRHEATNNDIDFEEENDQISDTENREAELQNRSTTSSTPKTGTPTSRQRFSPPDNVVQEINLNS